MLPSKVKIGATWWTVEVVEKQLDERGLNGECDWSNNRILIAEEQSSAEKEVTLLHEIMHACCRFTGIDPDKRHTEEDFVTRVSPILMTVLIENPQFWAVVR